MKKQATEAMTNKRKEWDEYFLDIAQQVSTRATCDRLHVGSVAVRDRNILATGYNGSVKGLEHCDDVGHMLRDNHCVRTVHSEQNLVAQAAKNGVALNGATVYCTHSPCWNCFKILLNSGIAEIVFRNKFKNDDFNLMSNTAKEAGILFRWFKNE